MENARMTSTERQSLNVPDACLRGGGEMGARMRALDWAQTPVGPVQQWPQSLKTAVQIMLGSRYPMFVWWGHELTNLYNDAYAPMLGRRHPHALGRSAPQVWADVWDVVGPQATAVLNDGHSSWNEERLLIMERYGYPEETYFTFSYSPVVDETGGVGGVFCAVTEDTTRVLGQRRLRTLRELATATFEAKDAAEVCRRAARALGANPYDMPFVLLYLLNTADACARLVGTAGVEAKALGAPPVIDLRQEADSPWPIRRVMQSGVPVCFDDLEHQVGVMPGGPWPAPSSQAMVLPLAQAGQSQLTGILIAGVSPLRPLDEEYRGFFSLVANSVATAIADARAYEAERQRAEALAELDRAKTTFFSNVSHEFRTPLTLMLGPLEDLLAQPTGALALEDRTQLEVMHRNGLRLLKLVNTLLDFARLQAGRIEAHYEPTDLATVTADLASIFRSAIERAGLRLQVECPPLPEAVYVDRDMWEKVVLNLLSNALKFTFAGEIAVRLRSCEEHVKLAVHDTGAGIPAHELPHLFERFYRIHGARARTHEGAGIGLALVQELVHLHGGQITVASEVGVGTTFTVTIPTGAAHLPVDRVSVARRREASPREAEAFVEEALGWLPAEPERGIDVAAAASLPPSSSLPFAPSSPHLLVADDNADMRTYMQRLLSPHWQVETVADGAQALAAARVRLPDLVLADVMMPGLDGLGLLRALRADPHTATVPVILLSARAGPEARVEGLEAGADDYLVKPFVAQELLARVEAHLKLARLRDEMQAAVREHEEHLRLALDAAELGTWAWDMTTNRVTWGGYHGQLFGLEPGHSLNTFEAFVACVHPNDRASLTQAIAHTLAEDTPYSAAYRIVRPDGAVRWIQGEGKLVRNAAGQPVRMLGTVRDITERRQTEEALRTAQEQLRLITDNVPALIAYVDRDERYRFINAVYERHHGLPRAQILGRTVREVREPIYEYLRPYLARALAGEPVTFENTYAQAGAPALQVSYVPDWQPDGQVAGVYVLITDITAHKQAQAELIRLNRELAQREAALHEANATLEQRVQERTAALEQAMAERQYLEREAQRAEHFALLGRLAAGVSHELRNPLGAVFLHVDLLTEELVQPSPDSPSVLAETLTEIKTNLARVDDLVQDYLSLVRAHTIQREVQDLGVAVTAWCREFQDAVAAHGVRLQEEGLETLGQVAFHAGTLRRALLNLVQNATEAMPQGGTVTLTGQSTADQVQIQVHDTGPGIPAERLTQIFEPLHTTKPGGTGLGLHIVQEVLAAHGGQVAVQSVVGQGTIFTLTLPRTAAAPAS